MQVPIRESRVRGPALVLALTVLVAAGRPQSAVPLQTELLAPDAALDDRFGQAVAIDGDTVVVGAPLHDGAGDRAGAAYVFERAAGAWSHVQTLTALDAQADDQLGRAVAIDGDALVLGAPENTALGQLGSAYVFERTAHGWRQTAKLLPSLAVGGATFGFAVDVDAQRIVVGAPGDNAQGVVLSGSAFVFERAGVGWSETAKLIAASPGLTDQLGTSVALEGGRIAAGAPGTFASGGAVHVFDLSGAAWSETVELGASGGGSGHRLGEAVSLAGTRVLAGAPMDETLVPDAGAAYLFRDDAGGWSLEAVLRAPIQEDGAGFGGGVALDVDSALIGAAFDDLAGVDAGSLHVFRRVGASWSFVSEMAALHPGAGDRFAGAVALDGRTGLAGAARHDHAAPDSGAAFVLALLSSPSSYCTAKANSQGCTPKLVATGFPGFSQTSPFLVTTVEVVNQKNGMFFYGTSGAAALPFAGGTLCVGSPVKRTPLVGSGGNPPPADCSGSFAFDLNAWLQGGLDPGLLPGVSAWGQTWYRDPAHPDGSGVGLSDALRFAIWP